MNSFERIAVAVRRATPVSQDHPIWRFVRPIYLRALKSVGSGGLSREINGTDAIRVLPELYNLDETYEPEVWHSLMQEVRQGDVVADVGASIGLYTLALAKRVSSNGKVFAFEPDPATVEVLHRMIALNDHSANVVVYPAAVGAALGRVSFAASLGSQSHVTLDASGDTPTVPVDVVTLDDIFRDTRVDILKVDVEGFEEDVLRGAASLLTDSDRAPRALFVEVHPVAMERFGASGASLLRMLDKLGYDVTDVRGHCVREINMYGEIVARARHVRSR